MHPYKPFRVGVVQTVLPGIKPSVLDKTLRVTGERLGRTGSTISGELRTPHAAGDVASAIAERRPAAQVRMTGLSPAGSALA